jgi:radical SAM superfamily enzyme YgiQ (UPF0313 family)
MKILLISANKEKGFRPALPIGMIVVATSLLDRGHRVECLDLCFEDDGASAIKNALEKHDPDVVGFSVRNIDNQNFLEPLFHLPSVRKHVLLCRSLKPACTIILGGPGFTVIPEELMRYARPDFGIIGPGEESFPALLEGLAGGLDVGGIPGLAYFDNQGDVAVNDADFDVRFDRYRLPKRELYDKRYFSGSYHTPMGMMEAADAVESKRGCSLPCIYCANFKNGGRAFRLKDPARVADEIEAIIGMGIAHRFEFTEGAFNIPHDHALSVCRELVRRNIRFPWNCMFNPGVITEELADLMARSGCDLVELGSESGSDLILKNLKKDFTVSQLKKTHIILTTRGIKAEHCVFIGSPGETRQTIQDTFDIMDGLLPDGPDSMGRLFITLGYRIFKGNELYNIALEQGVLRRDDDLAVPRFYIAPEVLRDDSILKLIEERAVGHANRYLWWGLPAYSLTERVKQVEGEYKKMERMYNETVYSLNP